jgi:hypothetical protein
MDPRALLLAGLAALASWSAASAQGFQAQISPPRFEDVARPGTVYRNVVEISNPAQVPMRLTVSTADWLLDESGTAQFSGPLAPGSCRPWTALEATQIEVPANGRRRFRFEVRVPADAADGQCRFGLMFEGEPTAIEGIALPVAGRIGVIVYLDVGAARAQLELASTSTQVVAGQTLPVLSITNTGNAHARLNGLLDAVDATGERWTLLPSGVPILPGSTRDVTLTPLVAEGEPSTLAFPVRITGRLDWRNVRLDVDTSAGQ